MPEIRRCVPDAVLVVPGNPTPAGTRLAAQARELGLDDALVLPGWVSAADLEGLYEAASCFAFPSLREGFGLPVLEAMRRGLAVACSNASAVPEVAGDAALLFDPTRVDEIAGAVARLLTDDELRSDLAERGSRRSAEFTWQRAAENTLASFDRALRPS
jgi:glycosyltransferase involved in cell wall biosynthesis